MGIESISNLALPRLLRTNESLTKLMFLPFSHPRLKIG
jgi:hypothetical protein